MSHTLAELALTPVYRQAQRLLAEWVERDAGVSRQRAFRTRTALSRLDAAERHRLARWLAWVGLADLSRGLDRLDARIRFLDPGLHGLMRDALTRLPAVTSLVRDAHRMRA